MSQIIHGRGGGVSGVCSVAKAVVTLSQDPTYAHMLLLVVMGMKLWGRW